FPTRRSSDLYETRNGIIGVLYTPNIDYQGQDAFDYVATDGSRTGPATVLIKGGSITNVAPQISRPFIENINFGGNSVTITPDVRDSDSDSFTWRIETPTTRNPHEYSDSNHSSLIYIPSDY